MSFEVKVSSSNKSLLAIGATLSTLFPDLGLVMPLRVLGAGFSSLVVETATGIVFRIAKNRAAAAGQAKEARLLPILTAYVPFPVPNPQWYAGPSATFPFGVIGYVKLPGTPMRPESIGRTCCTQIATDIASFLLALHQFPIAEALALNIPGPADRRASLDALRADILPPLRHALSQQEYRTIAQWWDVFLHDDALQQFPRVLQHGDLWYENILVDEARQAVAGVIDFEQAAIGDLAQDFATLRYFGQLFVLHVIQAYQAAGGTLGAHFHYRMQKYWELRDFEGVQFAVRFNDAHEFDDSLRKLRDGPILNPHQASPEAG